MIQINRLGKKRITEIFNAIAEASDLDYVDFSTILGLKNPRSFLTTSAQERYMRSVIKLFATFSNMRMSDAMIICEWCGKINLRSETKDKCTKCKLKLDSTIKNDSSIRV